MNAKIEFSTNPIKYSDMLNQMDAHDIHQVAIPFSVILTSCNVSKKTASETLVFEDIIQAKNANNGKGKAQKVIINNVVLSNIVRNKQSDRLRKMYFINSKEVRSVNLRFVTHFKSHKETKYRRVI